MQGGTVYFADQGAGGTGCDAGCAPSVSSVATSGGAVTQLYAGSGVELPRGLVAHGTSVYLSTSDGRIVEIPASGGASKLLRYELTSDQGVAVDDTYLYWSNTSGNVMRMPLAGGTATPLAYSQQTSGVAADGTGVYWTNDGNGLGASGGGGGTVLRVAAGGSAVSTLATGLGYPWGIALGASSLYWFQGQGELWAATPK